MFLTDTFKKFTHQKTINKINEEKDRSFNRITFETALNDLAIHLKHGIALKEGMRVDLIKRLCVGLPNGVHIIDGNEYEVKTDKDGLKRVIVNKLF